MALQKEHTAFGRIVQFDDNKTEQVWDVFRDEFGRASVAEDGVTGWKIAVAFLGICAHSSAWRTKSFLVVTVAR